MEALTVELQEDKRKLEKGGEQKEEEEEEEGRGDDVENEGNPSGNRNTLTRTSSGTAAVEEGKGRQIPTKSLTTDSAAKINMAEKEKILMECKNQIKVRTSGCTERDVLDLEWRERERGKGGGALMV